MIRPAEIVAEMAEGTSETNEEKDDATRPASWMNSVIVPKLI